MKLETEAFKIYHRSLAEVVTRTFCLWCMESGPSIHLRLATADRLRDRTCPNYILLKLTLSSSPPWRRRIEGCGKKVGGKIFIQLCFFFHLHFDTSFGLLSVRGKSEFNLCIRTYFAKSPNMANIAASLGAQIPRSVINPVTKRAGVTSKP